MHFQTRSQVVGFLVKGCSSREIADGLGLKFYTATSHLKSIYRKLGVHKRTAVVAKVLTEGIPHHLVPPGFPPVLSGRLVMPASEIRLPSQLALPIREKMTTN